MIRYIKLRCQSCTSETCEKKPISSWCLENEGCTKEVAGIDADKYFHYIVEVWPELRRRRDAADPLWSELEEFLFYVHNLPAGERHRLYRK